MAKQALANDRPTNKQGLLFFFLINYVFVLILMSPYLYHLFPLKLYIFTQGEFYPGGERLYWVTTIYAIGTLISYPACLVVLALIPAWLVGLFRLSRRWTVVLAILLSSTLLLILLIDNFLFYLYRFHLSTTVLEMVINAHRGEIFTFSRAEWLFFIGVVMIVFCLETISALIAFRSPLCKDSRWPKRIYLFTLVLFAFSIYCWVSSLIYGFRAFAQTSNVFPFYNSIARHFLGLSQRQIDSILAQHLRLDLSQSQREMRYPLAPLSCQTPKQRLNILLILIDTWRFDALNEKIMPHTFAFARNNSRFRQHYSGGNATEPGVFSLFYSLPNTYWTAISQQNKIPVLMQRLHQLKYRMYIHASASLEIPDFAHTVFRQVSNLSTNTPGQSVSQRDQSITRKMVRDIQTHDANAPFFGFVFYDSAHNYCSADQFTAPFTPVAKVCRRYYLNNDHDPTPMLNRYFNAVHFVDQQVAQLLAALREKKLLKNTIVMITGDHGEEFNDLKLNYWGHTSNFSKYQLQVPLVIHWPERNAADASYLTSHYDIVPTLMQRVLACQNPDKEYSFGYDLFNARSRYPLIVANNYMTAYITPNRITSLFPSGTFQIQNRQGVWLENEKPSKATFSWFMKTLNRFFVKE